MPLLQVLLFLLFFFTSTNAFSISLERGSILGLPDLSVSWSKTLGDPILFQLVLVDETRNTKTPLPLSSLLTVLPQGTTPVNIDQDLPGEYFVEAEGNNGSILAMSNTITISASLPSSHSSTTSLSPTITTSSTLAHTGNESSAVSTAIPSANGTSTYSSPISISVSMSVSISLSIPIGIPTSIPTNSSIFSSAPAPNIRTDISKNVHSISVISDTATSIPNTQDQSQISSLTLLSTTNPTDAAISSLTLLSTTNPTDAAISTGLMSLFVSESSAFVEVFSDSTPDETPRPGTTGGNTESNSPAHALATAAAASQTSTSLGGVQSDSNSNSDSKSQPTVVSGSGSGSGFASEPTKTPSGSGGSSSSNSPNSNSNSDSQAATLHRTAVVAGATAGALFVVIVGNVLIVLFILARRRKRRNGYTHKNGYGGGDESPGTRTRSRTRRARRFNPFLYQAVNSSDSSGSRWDRRRDSAAALAADHSGMAGVDVGHGGGRPASVLDADGQLSRYPSFSRGIVYPRIPEDENELGSTNGSIMQEMNHDHFSLRDAGLLAIPTHSESTARMNDIMDYYHRPHSPLETYYDDDDFHHPGASRIPTPERASIASSPSSAVATVGSSFPSWMLDPRSSLQPSREPPSYDNASTSADTGRYMPLMSESNAETTSRSRPRKEQQNSEKSEKSEPSNRTVSTTSSIWLRSDSDRNSNSSSAIIRNADDEERNWIMQNFREPLPADGLPPSYDF